MTDSQSTLANKKASGDKKITRSGQDTTSSLAPVITVDGPSGSGKGTIASAVAQRLGFHFLDSGALYRVVALASLNGSIADDDLRSLVDLAKTADIVFRRGEGGDSQVLLEGQDVTRQLRHEDVGDRASRIATLAPLRTALFERQRRFRRMPGLVADGRDMGTIIFVDAVLKIYLTADQGIRAERRHKQLIEKGIAANIDGLLADIVERDNRDYNREIAPLVAASDAITIDSTALTIDQVVTKVLDFAGNRI